MAGPVDVELQIDHDLVGCRVRQRNGLAIVTGHQIRIRGNIGVHIGVEPSSAMPNRFTAFSGVLLTPKRALSVKCVVAARVGTVHE
ncbi:hypothetical protein Pla52o_24030 [Novipirellula galeiformis]|uniref:Uncharacterized protein n=2 Tax=Novipirellula galeiformis TaxID=2528004 RepID=A0A5C6CHV0_9BACT|nr:hypothetical protein Pla52o_24030 [Novipirellula galeiformis]